MSRLGGPMRNDDRIAEQSVGTPLPSGSTTFPGGLPLPTLQEGVDEGAARYAVTSVDDDGRLADRSILTFLGWAPGQRIDLAIEPGPIVGVRRNGDTAINSRGFLRIPLPMRRRCGIATRDRVLVVAYERPQELLIIPMSTADDLLRAYRRPHLGGAPR